MLKTLKKEETVLDKEVAYNVKVCFAGQSREQLGIYKMEEVEEDFVPHQVVEEEAVLNKKKLLIRSWSRK